MKKFALTFILLLVLCSLLFSIPEIKIAKAESTIYIRSDGSVEGTDKIQRDGNVYSFTGNINDSIVVEKDDIVVDGASYTLQGTENFLSKGIDMSNRSNVTIRNMQISGVLYYGIHLDSSSNNTISRNYITNTCLTGIELWESSNNIISDNNITAEGGILLHSSNDNIISDNNIITTRNGIFLEQRSDDNIISGNYITNNRLSGIHFGGSSNQIVGNYIANNGNGTYIFSPPWGVASSNNLIYNNNYINNTRQISIFKGFMVPDSINIWDDGVEGNYWSDYEERYPNATEIDGSGIWDIPYVIDENNQDNYPIVPEFPAGASMLLTLIVLTVAIVTYKRRLSGT